MIRLLFKLTLVLLFVLFPIFASATYLDPTTKTNVNKQTDLFERSIDNLEGYKEQIENSKGAAIDSFTRTGGDSKALEFISDKSKSEIELEASNLSAIGANDLNARGREEMIKTGVIEDIHIDYTKPLNIQHKKDAVKIAEGAGKLLGHLMGLLKEIGVDCKNVKGNKVSESEYYIDIKNERIKNTIYTQTICEELRNSYACNDSVKLTCKQKKLRIDQWLDQEIIFDGHEIFSQHFGWMQWIHWKRDDYGGHMQPGNPEVMADVRRVIAEKLGKPIDHIGLEIVTTLRGLEREQGGGTCEFGCDRGKWMWYHGFRKYLFKYKLGIGTMVCAEWAEDWTEKCRVQ